MTIIVTRSIAIQFNAARAYPWHCIGRRDAIDDKTAGSGQSLFRIQAQNVCALLLRRLLGLILLRLVLMRLKKRQALQMRCILRLRLFAKFADLEFLRGGGPVCPGLVEDHREVGFGSYHGVRRVA